MQTKWRRKRRCKTRHLGHRDEESGVVFSFFKQLLQLHLILFLEQQQLISHMSQIFDNQNLFGKLFPCPIKPIRVNLFQKSRNPSQVSVWNLAHSIFVNIFHFQTFSNAINQKAYKNANMVIGSQNWFTVCTFFMRCDYTPFAQIQYDALNKYSTPFSKPWGTTGATLKQFI